MRDPPETPPGLMGFTSLGDEGQQAGFSFEDFPKKFPNGMDC